MKGYLRSDGRKGLRNVLVVAYLVECAHEVAIEIAQQFQNDNVHVIGFGGCAPNAYAERMMQCLCTHPNVGAVLVVSLGCENFHSQSLMATIRQSGRPAELIIIQNDGGTLASVKKGVDFVKTELYNLKKMSTVNIAIGDLTIGSVCGGSDAMSGFTANPSVGLAFDKLIARGARCLFEESGELIGCEHLMMLRGATNEIGKALYECIKKADRYYKKMGHNSFSAGNAVGGLTTIEEKSLGSYSKSGTNKIHALIKPGDIPIESGLYFLDIIPDGDVKWGFPNVNDNAEIVEMIACGCHAILYTTGRGSVAGSAISPVIKICSNSLTYQKLKGDMDLNAGRIITDGASLDEISDEIIAKIVGLTEGSQSKSEALHHREFHLGYKYFEESTYCGLGTSM